MKKILASLISIALLASILVACSNSKQSSGSQNGESGNSSDKITISIHYPPPDQTANRKLEDDKVKRFEAAYPNVTIKKDDWQYNPDEIGIKMAANEAPTFFNTYATEGKFLVDKGWAADITEFYNNWKYKDQMDPLLQKQFIINNKVYGVTTDGYVTGIVINKKLLDDAGVPVPPLDWTWDDFYNTAKAVANPSKGIAGVALMGQGPEAGWNWTNFLFEAGGEIQQVANNKVTAAFDSDSGLKALQLYSDLKWKANAIPQDWSLNWGGAVGAFAQGKVAMVIAGADGVSNQALNQGGMDPKNVLVYPMPSYQTGDKHIGVLGGDYMVINPKATKAQQEMAFKYITFDYFSDNGLKSLEANIQQRKKDKQYYIPPVLQYFDMNSDYGKKVKALYDKYDNVYQYNPETLKLYDGKPEAQYNTQDYYSTMTTVIQQIFSKKNVDLKAELQKASETVQQKYFDNIK